MKMSVAVIGLGTIATKAYFPILSSREEIELLLCSRNPSSVARFQAQYHIRRGTTNLDELIDWHPQAAFVLTPSTTHRAVVERLLSADIDVYVEKPLTLNIEDTRFLAELADEKGRILMVGFNRRFAPLHIQARQLWGNRPIQMAVLQKNRSSAYHPNLYQNYIDDTIHIIDTLRFLCIDATAVHTSYQIAKDKLVGAASTVSFGSGGFGLVLTSLQAGAWFENYALHGGGVSLYIDAFSRLELVTEKEHKIWEESYASAWRSTLEARGFVGEIDHFFNCLNTRAQPSTSAWESLNTQQLLEAMVKAGDTTHLLP